jgi:hypothetical protein
MNIEELGRRAVACKHWRWMPGMLASNGEEDVRIFYTSADNLLVIEFEDCEFGMVRIPKDTCLIPDLSDPATLGCLLALVREAYEDEWTRELSSFFDATAMGWRVGVILKGTALIPYAKGCSLLPFESEAEALVSALEGAP